MPPLQSHQNELMPIKLQALTLGYRSTQQKLIFLILIYTEFYYYC